MNRRSFLRGLFGAAAVATAPTYFFAPIGGWKSDTIVNPNEVAIGQYADYVNISDFDIKTAISYSVRFSMGLPPDATTRIRRVLTPPKPEPITIPHRTFLLGEDAIVITKL